MARNSSSRGAFTIVEMVVVFAVIMIIMGLLLMAVQRVRETSNRVICRNNLKQMGAAFLAHESQWGSFPSGGRYWYDTQRVWNQSAGGNRAPANFETQSWGWGYQILPYTDQNHIWSLQDDNLVGDNPIRIYNCPTARPQVRFWYGQAGAGCYRYMWDYSGNGGSWGDWQDLTIAANGLDGPIVGAKVLSGRISNSSTMTDGPSNIMLIGEKWLTVTARQLQPVCSDDQGWVDGWDNDAVAFCRGTSPSGTPTRPLPYDDNVGCGFLFGSGHATMQCVFADGSVHSLRFDIDPTTFLYLCVVNDGNPLPTIGID